ncbi:MAG: hypothetical protein AMS26_01095 [Bacteroides sp. SM23_62]|nr:MAG: hypothetical protein AMS26_01095 [Bacteroides sp. SM23_62]
MAEKKSSAKAKSKQTASKAKKGGKTKSQKSRVQAQEKDFIKTIESGLKEAGEQAAVLATEIAEKTSKYAADIFEIVKKGASEAYDYSAVVLDDLYQLAEKYAKKYKNKVEIRKLNTERDDLTKKLGSLVHRVYKLKKLDATFFTDKSLTDFLVKIDEVDKEIVKIGKKLDKRG